MTEEFFANSVGFFILDTFATRGAAQRAASDEDLPVMRCRIKHHPDDNISGWPPRKDTE